MPAAQTDRTQVTAMPNDIGFDRTEDLKLGIPVFMRITLSAYKDPGLKQALPDDYPLDNQAGIWLMRVAA
jgi:hypothetical protein